MNVVNALPAVPALAAAENVLYVLKANMPQAHRMPIVPCVMLAFLAHHRLLCVHRVRRVFTRIKMAPLAVMIAFRAFIQMRRQLLSALPVPLAT